MCTINTLNGKCRLTKDEKSTLSKYKNLYVCSLFQRLVSKVNGIFELKKGLYSPLLTSILSGVVETLNNKN